MKTKRGRRTKTIMTPEGLKRPCSLCEIVKPVSEFKRSGKYLTNRCRLCIRHASRLSTYGLTEESFQLLVAEQNGICAICTGPLGSKFAIDHCHDSGRIRGLLCYSCNTALGKFKDDPAILRAAIAYLDSDR